MWRNCLIAFGIWLAVVAGYVLYLRDWLRSPELYGAALLMGTAVSFGLLLFNAARHALLDNAAYDRLARGERPHDGDLVAAAGEIRPMLDSLRAPFTGRECVVYLYDIRTVLDREARAKDYTGFAITRCSVHTPYGSFALGSFPQLEGFLIEVAGPEPAMKYVADTKFTPMESVATIAKAAFGVYGTPPPFRLDWSIGRPPQSLAHAIATEIVVETGTRVIAYGRYSARDQSIVSDAGDKGYLRVRAQAAQDVRNASALGRAVAGLMLIGAAHAILWAILQKF